MDKKTVKALELILDKKFDQKLGPIKKTLDEHSKKLDEHSQRLDSLLLDIVDVQKKTDILPDIFDILKGTKEKVDQHEERIQNLENAA